MEMININFPKGNIWFKLKLKGNEGEEFEKLQLMMDRVGLDVRNIPNLKHLSSVKTFDHNYGFSFLKIEFTWKCQICSIY